MHRQVSARCIKPHGLAQLHITLDGESGGYRAVPVTGVEHDRVAGDNNLGVVFRILTGFPPRYFVRLDPR